MSPEDKARFDAIRSAVSHGAVGHEPKIANDMMFLCTLVRDALRTDAERSALRTLADAWRKAADGLRWHMHNPPELEVLEPDAHALEVAYRAEYEPSKTGRSFRTSRTAALIALRCAWKGAAYEYAGMADHGRRTDDALALDDEYQLDYGPFEDEPSMTDKQKDCVHAGGDQ